METGMTSIEAQLAAAATTVQQMYRTRLLRKFARTRREAPTPAG